MHGLGVKEAEPEGTPSWRLSVNLTSCGRFSVKGRAEQGSSMAVMVPSKLPLLVEFPFQAMLPSTMPILPTNSCFIILPAGSSPSPATATAGNVQKWFPVLHPPTLYLFMHLAVSSFGPSPEDRPLPGVCSSHHGLSYFLENPCEPSRKQTSEKP